MFNRESSNFTKIALFSCFIFTLPWLYYQSQIVINSNTAWLLGCAKRLLHGGTLLTDCYETNPPLSILIYTPFIFISEFFSVEIYKILAPITFLCAVISTVITYKIIQKLEILEQRETLVLCASFLSILTLWSTYISSEREHFIAMVILPFICAQLSITYQKEISKKLCLPVLILGTVFILVKPFYGILPCILFLHRIFVKKQFNIIKSIDFIILSFGTLLYVMLCIFIFPDFINIIMPDVLRFYIAYNNVHVILETAPTYILWCISLFFLSTLVSDQKKQSFLLMLTTSGTVCILIYIIQMKGFYYHLLPAQAFLLSTSSILVFVLISEKNRFNEIRKNILAVTILIGLFSFGYQNKAFTIDYAKHQFYKNNPIANYISNNCTFPCSYILTYNNMDVMNQVALYNDHKSASRFPALWFQPVLENFSKPMNINTHETLDQVKDRYANYIADDLERHKPSLIFILENKEKKPEENKKNQRVNLNIFEFYGDNKRIKKIEKTYTQTDLFTVDIEPFYRATPDKKTNLTWAVYKKNESHE